MSTNITIHTGRWVDYSQGKVMGEKFTVSSNHALVLIAFISIFDALVGSVVWNFLSYYIHQGRVTTDPRDGLHHQLQSLLRNTPDAINFAQQAAHISWSWKGRAPHAKRRGFLLSIVAIGVSLLFSAAGILSSQIASSGDVLMRNSYCGTISTPINVTDAEASDINDSLDSWTGEAARLSMAYAQNCYVNFLADQETADTKQFSPLAACDFFVQPSLPWTVTYDHPCPFGDSCSVPESQIIKLDTGLLDTQTSLGLNQPQENRLLWRKIETCSPLTTVGFSTGNFRNISQATKGTINPILTSAATYNYGRNSAMTIAYSTPDIFEENYTFVYPQAAYAAANIPYFMQTISTLVNEPGDPTWVPDSRIVESSDDPISLFFLANRVTFQDEPVTDPWFKATNNVTLDILNYDEEVAFFSSDEPGNVLACLEQVEICNPNTPGAPKCYNSNDWYTLLWEAAENDIPPVTSAMAALDLNDMQFTLAVELLESFQLSSFLAIVDTLGGSSLQAYSYLSSTFQLFSQPLNASQWQIEMGNWMTISLAIMQQQQLESVTGPSDPYLVQYLVPYPANDTIDNSLCSSQKIRSTAYQSFSIVGLALNIVLGVTIIFFGIWVNYALPRWQKLRGSNASRRKEWIADGALQLQRMVYEERGLGDWEGDEVVPLSKEGQLFGPLQLKGTEKREEGGSPSSTEMRRVSHPAPLGRDGGASGDLGVSRDMSGTPTGYPLRLPTDLNGKFMTVVDERGLYADGASGRSGESSSWSARRSMDGPFGA